MDSQITRRLKTETGGTGNSEEENEKTKTRKVEDETRKIQGRLHFKENAERRDMVRKFGDKGK